MNLSLLENCKSHAYLIFSIIQKSDWGTSVPWNNVENCIKLGFVLE
jgi:hypothetical protein